jgi:hypothetical protein
MELSPYRTVWYRCRFCGVLARVPEGWVESPEGWACSTCSNPETYLLSVLASLVAHGTDLPFGGPIEDGSIWSLIERSDLQVQIIRSTGSLVVRPVSGVTPGVFRVGREAFVRRFRCIS